MKLEDSEYYKDFMAAGGFERFKNFPQKIDITIDPKTLERIDKSIELNNFRDEFLQKFREFIKAQPSNNQ